MSRDLETRAAELELERAEIERYGRQLVLPELGIAGQKRLKAARVLVVGAGGLGSPLGLYLAAAGVGTIGIVDFDRVETSNLHRQVLFTAADLGRPKTEAAAERLRATNPHVEIVAHPTRLDATNARELVAAYDVVADGSDNFATRYLVNDACVLEDRPLAWGAVARFEGQVAVFGGRSGPCYRCLFPEPPPPGLVPNCAEGGVLGVLPGIIGALQANEAIKLVTGIGEPSIGRLIRFDALSLRWRELRLEKNPACPICSAEPALRELIEYDSEPCGPPGERDAAATTDEAEEDTAVADHEAPPFDVDVDQLKTWLDADQELTILDVREPQEREICHIEGSTHIPMGEIPDRLDELDRDRLIVVHCHHGPRSSQVTGYLRQQGFERATNLDGGIDDWSLRVDPTVPRY